MACCRTLAVLALLTVPAAAQTPPATAPAAAIPLPPLPPGAPPLPTPVPTPSPPPPMAAPASAPRQAPQASAAPPAAPPAPQRQVLQPAPMPDPMLAPDLQGRSVHTPTLTALVAQSAWQDAVVAAARSQYRQLPGNCPAASFKPTGELVVYVPAQFDQNGVLQTGIWNERVTVSGCGAPILLNILSVIQPGNPPSRIPTMPGDTHADPSTQKTALQYAQAVAARAAAPNCRQEVFTNTKFDGYTGLPNPAIQDGRPVRAWREVWSLYSCGVPYTMEMTFTPNTEGMQLSASNPVHRP